MKTTKTLKIVLPLEKALKALAKHDKKMIEKAYNENGAAGVYELATKINLTYRATMERNLRFHLIYTIEEEPKVFFTKKEIAAIRAIGEKAEVVLDTGEYEAKVNVARVLDYLR